MNDTEQFLRYLTETVIVQNDPQLGDVFDRAIALSIRSLEAKGKEQKQKQVTLLEKRRQALLDPSISRAIIDHIEESQADEVDFEIINEQQKAALVEMQLLYFYKSYEIALKALVEQAYHEPTTDLYNWDKQIKYFKIHQINVRSLPGFKELDQLRGLVNSIKHSPSISNKAKAIPELKGCKEVTYSCGTHFYKRIKPKVNEYFSQLSVHIFNSLYPS